MMHKTLTLALAFMLLTGTSALAQTAFDDPNTATGSVTGSLVAVEPVIELGSMTLGSTSQAIIRFRNDAAQAVTFNGINLYPSSNISTTITLDQCKEAPLQFGGECAIVLAVKALKAGPAQTQVLVAHSGRSKLITATVKGDVDAGDKDTDKAVGEIQASPDLLEFGEITKGSPVLRTVELRNITSDPLTVTSLSFDSPQKDSFQVKGSECKDLLPGQSCLVSIVWSPKQAGAASGFLVVNHSGTSKLTSIEVTGDYKPDEVEDMTQYPQPIPGKGLMTANETEIDFGDDVANESSVTLTLANVGDANMTIKGMSLSVITPGMTLDPTGCKVNQMLKPTDACALTVRWAPQKIGSIKTDLRVMHDGTRGVLVLPIKGKASAVTQGSAGFASIPTAAPENDIISESATGGIATDLPGSAGLTLDDVNELSDALTGDIAGVIARSTGKSDNGKAPQTVITEPKRDSRLENAAANLAGYIVTTHSINRAIILGPNGSKIVTHNKSINIGGQTWIPEITPDGVLFRSSKEKSARIVTLGFDSSITANQSLLTDNSSVIAPTSGASGTATTAPTLTEAIAPTASTGSTSPAPETAPTNNTDATQTEDSNASTGLPPIFENDLGSGGDTNN